MSNVDFYVPSMLLNLVSMYDTKINNMTVAASALTATNSAITATNSALTVNNQILTGKLYSACSSTFDFFFTGVVNMVSMLQATIHVDLIAANTPYSYNIATYCVANRTQTVNESLSTLASIGVVIVDSDVTNLCQNMNAVYTNTTAISNLAGAFYNTSCATLFPH